MSGLPASCELILGGQRSGKSRCAESRAVAWLQTPGHEALLIATATVRDQEMRERIDKHRRDRAVHVPALSCVEEPRDLPGALRRLGAPHRLLVVDCLTLWLSNLLMPTFAAGAPAGDVLDEAGWRSASSSLIDALAVAPGPVVLVSNEIGLGVIPLGAETRRYVDELGRLHQRVAAVCPRLTLMVAGIEMRVKDQTQ
jgi:adenosylcobinamide kinase / adenosylcobinamide-phosphate guanylyltransferase